MKPQIPLIVFILIQTMVALPALADKPTAQPASQQAQKASASKKAVLKANEGGKGGGGLKRDGQVLTFQSAGFHLGLQPVDNPPGLDLLKKTIMSLDLNQAEKARLLEDVSANQDMPPLGVRRYFSISEQDLSPKKRAAMVKAYAKSFQPALDPKTVTLFAITDGPETYLLPEFFQLKKESELTAILLHESAWVENERRPMNSHLDARDVNLSYNQVIDTEMSFQRYLDNGATGYDYALYSAISYVLDDPQLPLGAAIRNDYKAGRLSGFVAHRSVSCNPKLDVVPGFTFDWLIKDMTAGDYFTVPDGGVETLNEQGYARMAGTLLERRNESPDLVMIQAFQSLGQRVNVTVYFNERSAGQFAGWASAFEYVDFSSIISGNENTESIAIKTERLCNGWGEEDNGLLHPRGAITVRF